MKVPVKDYIRQLQYLQVQSKEILKEDGVYRNEFFYKKLEPFLRFYEEIRKAIMKDFEAVPHLKEKASALPEIEFRNYDSGGGSFVFTIGYAIFFPVGIYYIAKKLRYVNQTKEKLKQVSAIASSLETLLMEKNQK